MDLRRSLPEQILKQVFRLTNKSVHLALVASSSLRQLMATSAAYRMALVNMSNATAAFADAMAACSRYNKLAELWALLANYYQS